MRLSYVLNKAVPFGHRSLNNRLPQGMTKESFKKNIALWPLFGIMGCGGIFVISYAIRLATKTTDVSWRKEAEPYNYYIGKQFKFLNVSGRDYSKAGMEIPNYRDVLEKKE